MYTACITCHRFLGRNEEIDAFPVGARLAFDSGRGRLWVVCQECGRWNLSPLDERWEAIEECERVFRSTSLRISTDNIGLARLESGLELIRIGRALRNEVAAWRYGRRLLPVPRRAIASVSERVGERLRSMTSRFGRRRSDGYDVITQARLRWKTDRVLDAVPLGGDDRAILRVRHLAGAELMRPNRLDPWSMIVAHEKGPLVLTGAAGLRTGARLLAALNGRTAGAEHVAAAVRRLDDAGRPESYFSRVAALALRTGWGRNPDAPRDVPILAAGTSASERLALYVTNRSFWARGSVGSDPATLLPRLPLADRLALEMAANEDTERRASEGELAELEAAWREAEEVAAIADSMFDERTAARRTRWAVAAAAQGA